MEKTIVPTQDVAHKPAALNQKSSPSIELTCASCAYTINLEIKLSALLSVTIKVKNPDKFKEYISQVPATMAPHGGEKIGRGKLAKTLVGDVAHHMEALFQFPSTDALDQWFNSPEYQALAPLRDESAEMTLAVLESF